jgi:MbtH protein
MPEETVIAEEQVKVVVNDEEQYSIWPAERENAPGWRDEGMTGTREECLDHIERIWTDMRPLSLRRRMEAAEAGGEEPGR